MSHFRFAALTLLLLSFVAPVFADDVNVKKLHNARWIQLETENFSLFTNADEKVASNMARELERFRYFMATLLGYEQQPMPARVPVVLAKNNSTFTALGFPDSIAGVFVQNYGQHVIFASADGFKSSAQGKGNWGRAVVLHELVHLLINNSTLEFAWPFWYQEGIAEYFGTYMEKKDSIILGDMSVLGGRFYGMLAPGGGTFVGINSEALFNAKQSNFKIGHGMNSSQSQSLDRFYARSAAVVHYLNSSPELRKQLYTYLALLKQGYEVDEVFIHVFEMTYEEFDKQVHDYIFSKYVLARTFPMGKGGVEFPEYTFTASKPLEKRRALELIKFNIGMLPDNFLSEESRSKMRKDIEKIYPDFYEN